MNQAKHTPAPWAVVPNYSSCHYMLWDADGNYHDMTEPVAEMNANAALMAAAPDLLTALKNLVKALDVTGGDLSYLIGVQDTTITVARDAIRAAEGRS